MEFTKIPNLNKKVSRIGLGAWSIGGALWGGTDERQAIDTIHKALDIGINFIDTAPGYGNGASEEVVGKAIKEYGDRENIIIATKFGLNMETSNVFRDSRKAFIKKEIENSLRRLQVDYIDLYQAHWPDPTTPISETAQALKELLDEGKIKAIGVSNYTVDQMKEFKKTAPLHSDQPPFNILEREAEADVIPYCFKERLAIIGYSALCRGMLSGKMSKERKFGNDDVRKNFDPKFKEPQFSQYLECVDELKNWVQRKHRRPLVALAVRWVLDKNINVSLWGARKPEQLADLDKVFGWHLSKEDFAEIDEIINETVKDPVGPQFMAPPVRQTAEKH